MSNHQLFRSNFAAIVVAWCLIAYGTDAFGADDVAIHLSLSSTRIRTYDPLFVRVTVENLRDEAIMLPSPMSAATGHVRFFYKRNGLPRSPIATAAQGTVGSRKNQFTLDPQRTYIVHEALFRTGPSAADSVFLRPGEVQFFSEVRIDGKCWCSKPTSLQIIAMDESQSSLLKQTEIPPSLISAVRLVDGLGKNITWTLELARLEEELAPDCELARALKWGRLLLTVQTASIDDKTNALAALNDYRNHLDDVTNEVIALKLSDYYMNTGRLESAVDFIQPWPNLQRHQEKLKWQIDQETRTQTNAEGK